MTRSTLRAGTMKAGDNLTDAPVAALLADVKSVADADALQPVLEHRYAEAQAARAAHGDPDPLTDDAAIDAHADGAVRLDREVTRCRSAVERLAQRRAELDAAAEHDAAAALVESARAAVVDAEAEIARYITDARSIAKRITRLRELQAVIETGRRAARAHGLDAEGLVLPHERRTTLEEWAAEEVVEHGVRRRIERRIRSATIAPNLADARAELPCPDGGPAIVSQGQDRR